ncbi:MAG: class I SAM-dependent methyltransferase [Pseudomonadota bacterium]|nr:class I SAM-dependent methyltransferase [Pseudomonadota bacterium]
MFAYLYEKRNDYRDLLFENRFAYRYLLPLYNKHVLVPQKTGRENQIRESPLAHEWLDGLKGVEVGPCRRPTRSGWRRETSGGVTRTTSASSSSGWGCFSHLHIESRADEVPLPDGAVDFVLSSHVIEHCVDPIKAAPRVVSHYPDRRDRLHDRAAPHRGAL